MICGKPGAASGSKTAFKDSFLISVRKCDVMKTIISSVLLIFISLQTSVLTAQVPDGTVVYSSKPNAVIGRVAKRWATRAQGYAARDTHVGIVLGGRVYHADYPSVTSYPVGHDKPGVVVRYEYPNRQYTPQQIDAMKRYAQSQIGQPYRLSGFIRNDGGEGWCSQFVRRVKERAGHKLSYRDGFTPDNLRRALNRGNALYR